MHQPLNQHQLRRFRQQLRKLERELSGQLRGTVECCGVSVIQCHTLLEIETRERTRMSEIADFFRIDKSTISRTIDILVRKGLISRSVNPENRRFQDIELTEKGQEMCRNIHVICDRYYSELFSLLPREKLEQVSESFAIFTDALKTMALRGNLNSGACTCNSDKRRD